MQFLFCAKNCSLSTHSFSHFAKKTGSVFDRARYKINFYSPCGQVLTVLRST